MKYLLLVILIFPSYLYSQMDTIVFEDFNDNSGNWWVGEESGSNAKIENGHYIIQNDNMKSGRMYWKEFKKLNYYGDFYFETKIRLARGPEDKGINILFGLEDSKNTFKIHLLS